MDRSLPSAPAPTALAVETPAASASATNAPPPAKIAAGVLAAFSAQVIWGFTPIIYIFLKHVPIHEIMAHRIVWAAAPLMLIALAMKKTGALISVIAAPKRFLLFVVTTLIFTAQTALAMYAVLTDRILDMSLAYFIAPLFIVAAGVIVLKERLSPLRWAAVACVAVGLALQIGGGGAFPWIAVSIAALATLYTYLRKTAATDSITGLTIEILMLTPFALVAIAVLEVRGAGHFAGADGAALALMATGPATAIALLLFIIASRAVQLSTIGVMSYFAPSLQFAVALFLGERVEGGLGQVFAFVWAGIAIYWLNEVNWRRVLKDIARFSHEDSALRK